MLWGSRPQSAFPTVQNQYVHEQCINRGTMMSLHQETTTGGTFTPNQRMLWGSRPQSAFPRVRRINTSTNKSSTGGTMMLLHHEKTRGNVDRGNTQLELVHVAGLHCCSGPLFCAVVVVVAIKRAWSWLLLQLASSVVIAFPNKMMIRSIPT